MVADWEAASSPLDVSALFPSYPVLLGRLGVVCIPAWLHLLLGMNEDVGEWEDDMVAGMAQ